MENCCIKHEDRETKNDSFCPLDQSKGKRVKIKTIRNHIKGKWQREVKTNSDYFFCSSRGCDVVYFSNEGQIFKKDQMRTMVGEKEIKNPEICYCFNFFESDIRDEIETSGKTRIPDFIKERIKEGSCACEIMNPSGSCCLGNISKAVKRIKNARGNSDNFPQKDVIYE